MKGCELKSLLLLPFVDYYAHVGLCYENFDWFTHRSVKKNLISTASSFRVNDYLTHVTTLMDMQDYGLSIDHFEHLIYIYLQCLHISLQNHMRLRALVYYAACLSSIALFSIFLLEERGHQSFLRVF